MMENLKIGIEFNQESLDKLSEIKNIIEQLNKELEKLGLFNMPLQYKPEIHIHCDGFIVNEKDVQEIALLMKKYMVDEENRKSFA